MFGFVGKHLTSGCRAKQWGGVGEFRNIISRSCSYGLDLVAEVKWMIFYNVVKEKSTFVFVRLSV